jgi:hypothetical protein
MDIERMHNMLETLTECAEAELSNGLENVDPCEMSQVIDMIKDLSEALYHRVVTEAMSDTSATEIASVLAGHRDKNYVKGNEVEIQNGFTNNH